MFFFWLQIVHIENLVFVLKKKVKLPFWVQCNLIEQVHMHITPRIKRVSIKSLGVLKCFVCWVSDGQVARTVLHQNNGALVGFALKCT